MPRQENLNQEYFGSQAEAEAAYFRLLGEYFQRGQTIASLSRKLGRTKHRARFLAKTNKLLQGKNLQLLAQEAVRRLDIF